MFFIGELCYYFYLQLTLLLFDNIHFYIASVVIAEFLQQSLESAIRKVAIGLTWKVILQGCRIIKAVLLMLQPH